jgi:hypothetical protein
MKDRAQKDLALRARLILEARGIPRTTRTLAGALLEAERDAWLQAAAKGWIEQQRAIAKQSR